MTRRAAFLLVLAASVSGCAHGLSGRQIYQAEGVLVVLYAAADAAPGASVPVAGEQLAGELLVVEPGAWVVDALGPDGRPARVVRVAQTAIRGGAVYAGTTGGRWAVSGAAAPEGARRVARITTGGGTDSRLDLRLLSRFPHGLSDALLDALLARRGQTGIATPPEASTP